MDPIFMKILIDLQQTTSPGDGNIKVTLESLKKNRLILEDILNESTREEIDERNG